MKNIFCYFICLLFVISLRAQDAPGDFENVDERKDWGFSITPYALLAAQSTDVDGERIRQSFNDLASITNSGFQVIATLRYKRTYVTYDGTFASLGKQEIQGPLIIDLSIKQVISDFKVGYIAYDNFKFEENNLLKGWSLEFTLGGKYWKNDVNVDYAFLINDTPIIEDKIEIPQSWWDLMLGTRAKFIVSPKFYLGVMFNIGGFGINNSSKLSHDFTYINTFRITKLINIDAGFRSFRYDRVDDGVSTTVSVLGPLLGVSFVL